MAQVQSKLSRGAEHFVEVLLRTKEEIEVGDFLAVFDSIDGCGKAGLPDPPGRRLTYPGLLNIRAGYLGVRHPEPVRRERSNIRKNHGWEVGACIKQGLHTCEGFNAVQISEKQVHALCGAGDCLEPRFDILTLANLALHDTRARQLF